MLEHNDQGGDRGGAGKWATGLCRISLGVLQKRFRASEAEPMQTVARSVIEAAARKLIEHEAYEEDGSILIRDRDI